MAWGTDYIHGEPIVFTVKRLVQLIATGLLSVCEYLQSQATTTNGLVAFGSVSLFLQSMQPDLQTLCTTIEKPDVREMRNVRRAR